METKEPPSWVIAKRLQYLNKASRAGFLDAVFYATYFNDHEWGKHFGCPIDPHSLFPNTSDDEIRSAIRRSNGLHHGRNAYVGEAYFKYPESRMTYEQAVAKLKQDNPGFCADAYDKVIHDNLRGMR
jgi:hypothetical protein